MVIFLYETDFQLPQNQLPSDLNVLQYLEPERS